MANSSMRWLGPEEPKEPGAVSPIVKPAELESEPRTNLGSKVRTTWPSTKRWQLLRGLRATVSARWWNIPSRRSGPVEMKVGMLVIKEDEASWQARRPLSKMRE